jgi:hypothetical protein
VEHLVDELLLQRLVGIVDAQLLERVLFKNLRPETFVNAPRSTRKTSNPLPTPVLCSLHPTAEGRKRRRPTSKPKMSRTPMNRPSIRRRSLSTSWLSASDSERHVLMQPTSHAKSFS